MRPRSDLVPALAYLSIFLLSAVLILPAATTWVRSDVDPIIGTLVLSGQCLLVYFVATQTARRPRVVPIVAACLLNGFLMAVIGMSVPLKVLADDGEQIRATVVEVYDGGSNEATYDLAADGIALPGRLGGWPGGGTGAVDDEVLVVQDPDGLADPRLPDELAQAQADDPGVLILPLVAIVAALCLAAVWPSRRRAVSAAETGVSRYRF
ncbi:hypothetical protein AB0G04_33530 [Actinoplanes sp. NPDC023801]|uniref:hypothetical protein n=1 Tax=Actinoplanes sp. NPDC023801 TaxID=3154595 RepID=UPI0033D9147A